MNVTIDIPGSLQRFTGCSEVPVEAATVGEALAVVAARHPQLQTQLFAPDGRPRSFIRVFLNSRDVRQLAAEATPVVDGDRIMLLPAVAGG